MSPTVALVAVGAHGDTAVGSRIGAFARGLTRRGDITGLVTLLRQAMRDRATLHTGRLGEGPTREPGVETLHTTLRRLLPDA